MSDPKNPDPKKSAPQSADPESDLSATAADAKEAGKVAVTTAKAEGAVAPESTEPDTSTTEPDADEGRESDEDAIADAVTVSLVRDEPDAATVPVDSSGPAWKPQAPTAAPRKVLPAKDAPARPDDATVALPRVTPGATPTAPATPAAPDDATVALPTVTQPPARPAAVVPPTRVSRPKAAPTKVGPGRPAPTAGPAGTRPAPATPRPTPPVASPAKIPASDAAASGKKRWPIVVALGAVLAVAVGGGYLFVSKVSGNSSEDQVKASINTFIDAIGSGDLTTLRSISCGELATYYAQIPDSEFADVYRVAVDQRSIPVVESIDTVAITDDTAIAQATVHAGATPNESSARSFTLQRDGDAWKVC